MRLWLWLVLAPLAAFADGASPTAAPIEAPPPGFTGTQFIDNAGCVLRRDGARWSPRTDSEGAPVCGYPPTPVAGRSTPTLADFTAPPPQFDGMSRIESELVATVTANMAPGDLAAPGRGSPVAPSTGPATVPPPPQADARGNPPLPAAARTRSERPAPSAQYANHRAEAPPAPGIEATLAAAVTAEAPIRTTVARGAGRSDTLCALLGLDPASPDARLRGDPTRGLCGGLAEPALVPRIARTQAVATDAARRHASIAPTAAAPRTPHTALKPARTATQRPSSHAPRQAPAAQSTPASRPALAPPATAPAPRTLAETIPAGARYLQLAAADPAATIARIRALGLPAAIDRKGTGAVLAGPFASRKAIVSAHDRLTRAGVGRLIPR